jgi:hypothetical protein
MTERAEVRSMAAELLRPPSINLSSDTVIALAREVCTLFSESATLCDVIDVLTKQRDIERAALAAARECIEGAYDDACREYSPNDEVVPAWVEMAQDVLGDARSNEIFERANK